jgi:predicted HTH transcriptional regulator
MICHHIQNLEKMLSEYKESIGNDTLKLGNDTLKSRNDTLNISEKEKAVYEAIKKDTTVSIAQIVSLTGFSRPTVNRAITALKDKKLIDRAGAKKNGSWIIK